MEVKDLRVNVLTHYQHWLNKSVHDLSRYQETKDVFDLANVLLDLNAIPEWIKESKEAPESLKLLARKKLEVMKHLELNEFALDEIDHQLRLVRLFCNHAKHSGPKGKVIQIEMCAILPASFPIAFDHMNVGSTTVEMLPIVRSLVKYWSIQIDSID